MTSDGGNSQLAQLNQARDLARVDPAVYERFLPALIPLLNSPDQNPSFELKAWIADFIAEAFSSPIVSPESKQQTSVSALPAIVKLLELPTGAQSATVDQTGLIKSAVQAASSIYPFVFRHM